MERAVIIYDAAEGEVVFDIDKEKETIWATTEDIAQLFGVQRAAITKHLNNILKDGELEEERICSVLEHMHKSNGRTYRKKVYNLDAIISVGYRVNSKKATKFRIWATKVLKNYIVGGVAVNEKRVKELSSEKLEEVEATLRMVRRLIVGTELDEGEAKGVLEVIARYGKTIETIGEFDAGRILVSERRGKVKKQLTIGEVVNLAENLKEEREEKGKFGEFRLEGKKRIEEFLDFLEREDSGETIAEKATRLLYFFVKNEPFKEGNSQIGALIFIYYLTVNDFHLSENGETKISDRALTAIVLLMMESKQEEKELIIEVVRKLLE